MYRYLIAYKKVYANNIEQINFYCMAISRQAAIEQFRAVHDEPISLIKRLK